MGNGAPGGEGEVWSCVPITITAERECERECERERVWIMSMSCNANHQQQQQRVSLSSAFAQRLSRIGTTPAHALLCETTRRRSGPCGHAAALAHGEHACWSRVEEESGSSSISGPEMDTGQQSSCADMSGGPNISCQRSHDISGYRMLLVAKHSPSEDGWPHVSAGPEARKGE